MTHEETMVASRPDVQLCEKLLNVIDTKAALEKAKTKVPSYTAQYSPEFFYMSYLEEYHEACRVFVDCLELHVGKSG